MSIFGERHVGFCGRALRQKKHGRLFELEDKAVAEAGPPPAPISVAQVGWGAESCWVPGVDSTLCCAWRCLCLLCGIFCTTMYEEELQSETVAKVSEPSGEM